MRDSAEKTPIGCDVPDGFLCQEMGPRKADWYWSTFGQDSLVEFLIQNTKASPSCSVKTYLQGLVHDQLLGFASLLAFSAGHQMSRVQNLQMPRHQPFQGHLMEVNREGASWKLEKYLTYSVGFCNLSMSIFLLFWGVQLIFPFLKRQRMAGRPSFLIAKREIIQW